MKRKHITMNLMMAALVVVSLCAVCASVSAAPGSSPVGSSSLSSANADTSAGLVGAPAGVVGAPAVCSQTGTNSLDLFVRGTDNAIYWRHEAGTVWGLWAYLGGYVTSDPSATSAVSGHIFVCARGGDGAFWSRDTMTGGSSWFNWQTLHGKLLEGTGPAAFSDGGVVYPAVIGTNHELFWWTSGGWKSLGGYLTSSPAGASYGSNMFVIAARGGDGAVWRMYTLDGGTSWHPWVSCGGRLLQGTSPAVVSPATGGANVAVIGTNNALYWWTGTSWTSLGGYLTSSPAAASHSTNVVDVFARGGDGNIWSLGTMNHGDNWSPWYKIAG